MKKYSLLDLPFSECEKIFEQLQLKKFVAKQIFH